MKATATRKQGGVRARERISDEYKHRMIEQLKAVARSVVATFGPNCEAVIHDFADLEQSIIWIEGNVTNRRIGGSVNDFGLARIQTGHMDDVLNYATKTVDGKHLKSSSIFLADPDGNTFGAFCINVDISSFLAAEQVLQSFTYRDDSQQIVETFSDDIQDVVQVMVAEAERELGKPISLMNKGERVALVARLEKKGAFRVKKAVPIVAELMKVSRYTIYKYLNVIHTNSNGGGNATQQPHAPFHGASARLPVGGPGKRNS